MTAMTATAPFHRCCSGDLWGTPCDSDPAPADKMIRVRYAAPDMRGAYASAPFRGRWTHGYFCPSCWEAAHDARENDDGSAGTSEIEEGYLEEIEELDP